MENSRQICFQIAGQFHGVEGVLLDWHKHLGQTVRDKIDCYCWEMSQNWNDDEFDTLLYSSRSLSSNSLVLPACRRRKPHRRENHDSGRKPRGGEIGSSSSKKRIAKAIERLSWT
ncbi:unnamed protein product [Linum trigynum]|uniref:Uncharacterized protein n=1 Tax=Linum trigynum TaxID=586398 RepID=A0AAV2G4L4_9ROSI